MVPSVLTAREAELLRLVAAGQTYRQTAATMGTTEQAIKNRAQVIFGTLGSDNITQAVAMALRRGLID